ncbi:NADPH:quinone oxidoreductase family protein [Rhodococcus pseudokoreensis]|uniref:NADPH:quinone oxidoreductase family protein n=1 Tax=Rhodococcus pseudokoreensis TaxID=2811421 RepID=A0A974W3W9_9NOCA|nr:NADPH:quinone oxidoreductase family protein [Rhodococcus pseudokoreensis]QSE90779.1 NADPH:quinone oxidoreductase family protein [Rhodococcus pseudokoreensis]
MTPSHDQARGTMRAWVMQEPGEPVEAMRIDEIPIPEPGPGQVLIRVAAIGISYGDLLLSRGEYQDGAVFPFTPGQEVVGEVVAAHRNTTTPVGTRVIALRSGGLAEFCVADEAGVFPAGETLTDADAAGFPIAFHTAWFALHRRAMVQPGETVVVHAAAGGIGSACVQLGVAAGARVIAVAGGETKVALCRKLGAHVVVDRLVEDFGEIVRLETDGRGADVIIDPVNGDVFDQSRRVIASEGRLVVAGFVANRIAEMRTNHVLLKNYSVTGVNLSYYYDNSSAIELVRAAHAELLELHRRGAIVSLVQREIPFEEAAQAISDIRTTSTWGRTIVRPPTPRP